MNGKTTSTKPDKPEEKPLTEQELVAKILELLPEMKDWEKQPTSIENVYISKFPEKGGRVERAMITLDLPEMQKDIHLSSKDRVKQLIAIFGNKKNQDKLLHIATVLDKAVAKTRNEPAPLRQENCLF